MIRQPKFGNNGYKQNFIKLMDTDLSEQVRMSIMSNMIKVQ